MNTLFSLQQCSVMIKQQTILAPVSFSVNVGDFVSITGPSGAGKSTLLQLLLGFISPTKGRLLFRNHELTAERLSMLRREVAVVFQEPMLRGPTIQDALLEPFSYQHNRHATPDKAQLVKELEAVGIEAQTLSRSVATLSGGEKQRIALVRALLLKRPLLVLDEISSALDSSHRDRVQALLLARDVTVISVSHDPVWIQASSSQVQLQPFAPVHAVSATDEANRERQNGSC